MDVLVDRERLDTGDLPRVCAVTGQPAFGLSEVSYSSMPSWAYALGAIPVLWMTQDMTAWLPVAEGVVERHVARTRLLRIAVAILTVALVAIVIGAVATAAGRDGTDSGSMERLIGWIVPGVLVTGLLVGGLINRGRTFVDLRPAHDGTGRVKIMGAHPDFVAAVESLSGEHASRP